MKPMEHNTARYFLSGTMEVEKETDPYEREYCKYIESEYFEEPLIALDIDQAIEEAEQQLKTIEKVFGYPRVTWAHVHLVTNARDVDVTGWRTRLEAQERKRRKDSERSAAKEAKKLKGDAEKAEYIRLKAKYEK